MGRKLFTGRREEGGEERESQRWEIKRLTGLFTRLRLHSIALTKARSRDLRAPFAANEGQRAETVDYR